VVEGGYAAPIDLVVTPLAADTKLALVSIILPVTRNAGRCQLVAIEIARMARIAFDFRMPASQRKFRCLVMVEANRTPLVLLVAGLAFGAVPSGVNILDPVAIDAHGANPLVAFADMARGADDGAMCALKRELGLVVVERFDPRPCCLSMTVVARFPKATLVRIDHLVTVEAAPRGIAELYILQMTAAARHGFVGIAQLEIRKGVVEGFAIEQDDVGVSSLVIGVAVGATLLCSIRLERVEAPACQPICGNFLVACQAQSCLQFSRERLVAIPAVLFELGVSFDDRAWNNKPFKKRLRTSGQRRSACDNHPNYERTYESLPQR